MCSPASSSSQQGSSSGDLLPEMMESETPPTAPPHGANNHEVSSRRSSNLLRLEADASAVPSPARSAPLAVDEKGPEKSGARPNMLASLLEQAALSECHHTLMGTMLEKISSTTSGLNEAFGSLLKGFEVREKIRIF